MKNVTSREIRLVSRPTGIPTAANFAMAGIELAPLKDQQVLVRNLYMSVDPYMRGRMNDGKSYVPPFELGKPLEGGAIGEVIESGAREFKPGDAVTSNLGWREYFIAAPKELRRGSDLLRHVQGGKARLKSDIQPKPDIRRRVKPDGVINPRSRTRTGARWRNSSGL
jgi:NADPH-dependent curcumin reductase CurA